MTKNYLRNSGQFMLAIVFLLLSTIVNAQIIGTPSLFFADVCPKSGDLYQAAVQVDSARFAADNIFFFELSDENGSFSGNITILTSVADNNEDLFSPTFGFDNSTYGDNYRIRVRSTSPQAVSDPSDYFGAYFVTVAPLLLNNDEDVVLDDSGKEKILTVNGSANKRYHWFRNGDFVAETATNQYTITEPGLYYVSTYYGDCTGLDYSNVISATGTTGSGGKIPTFISPNGDRFNDLWVLPEALSYNPKVEVSIFNESGTKLFHTNNYQNNWPQASVKSTKGFNTVVYYMIKEEGKVLSRGALTVMQ